MIVSFARRFIFVAIPKTATQAMRTALRPHLGPLDWEQCTLFERRSFPVGPLAALQHGHITCRELRPYLLPEIWDGSFRFCTVRNPFDRFVSYCYFIHRNNRRMQEAPLETMKRELDVAQAHVRAQPQSTFVVDEHGRLLVEYVCRFEALQEHFDSVCARLGVRAASLPLINQGPPREVIGFDRELEERLREVYASDFGLFDYPLDLESAASCRRLS